MFLIEDRRHGATYLVFTWEDPRNSGFRGDVIEGVTLEYDMEAVHRWDDGQPRPEVCVGRDKDTRKRYKVFKYSKDREAAGYEPVAGTALVFGSWSDYVQLNPDLEALQQLAEEKWYQRLDELDEASRRRRQLAPEPDTPRSDSRDDIADWLARTHFITDSSIREVWYLPRGAPDDEIRLLELNDRLAGNGSDVEPIDFGLDIEGAPFRLFVADVTSEQLEQIKHDTSRLPRGWSLDGNRVWRRGA
jgi:hypothetical protein